jgi:hypothetical protein
MSGEIAETPIYLALTRAFNVGRVRTVISSGQAVVLHRITMQSKDGDWLIREDEEACAAVLAALAGRGAHYRYGAPLHPRWLAGGWSSHLEFSQDGLRIRTDFVSRPPRLPANRLAALWREAETADTPVVGIPDLIELKRTDRERDYVIIGALAQRLGDPAIELAHGRDPERIAALLRTQPTLRAAAAMVRPWLASTSEAEAIAELLDAERRADMRRNRERLASYTNAAVRWQDAWPRLAERIGSLSLPAAHAAMCAAADGLLPESP